ncbi:MAG TPA: DUF1289 domain-containing protein [Holophagaceae bacterium]|nr:DUF1289 domain-containing protein [Holophagaceae bacterium]
MEDCPQPTPCVHVCAMDEDTGLCQGCHRSAAEICRWPGGLGGSVFAVTMPRLDEKSRP